MVFQTKNNIMELNEARKRFETIANKTGILSNQIIVERGITA
jgi:hypothetical protein